MPDPALLSAAKCLISGMPDTNEKYCNISENQIIRPPGHDPCVEVYFRDRKKLNVSFLRSFFVLMEKAVSFFWLYRRMACEKGYPPIAPHLLFSQFLNEGIEAERQLGISMGMELLLD